MIPVANRNLTSGPIERQIVDLALPLIAGNILQQLYNTVDALVIGRFVGQTAFAAIGVAGTVMNLFLFIVSGSCAGIAVLFARSFGGGELAVFRRQHYLCVLYGSACVLVLSGGGLLGLTPLLKLIRTPAEVAVLSRAYLSTILVGLICSYFYNLYATLLRAAGNSRVGLMVLAAAMACNLVLDLWFVAGLSWGIVGAARATVISQLLAAMLCLLYMRHRTPELIFRSEDIQKDSRLLRELGQYSFISAMHGSSLYIGKVLVQGAVNGLGTEMISAYTAASRVEAFANSFGDSGSSAMSIFIGQNMGAGKKGRIRYSLTRGGIMMITLSLVLGVLMAVTAPWTVGLLLGDGSAAALAAGVGYLRVISLFYVLCYIGNLFVGWFRGLGMMAVPTVDTCLHITIRVLGSYLLVGHLGVPAVAVATGMGWILVFVFFNTMLRVLPRSKEYYYTIPDSEN